MFADGRSDERSDILVVCRDCPSALRLPYDFVSGLLPLELTAKDAVDRWLMAGSSAVLLSAFAAVHSTNFSAWALIRVLLPF